MKPGISRILVLLFFVFLACVSVAFLLQKNKLSRQKAILNNTSHETFGFKNHWPLGSIDDNPNSYLVRVVLEKEIYFGSIAYGEHVIGAWNYGLFTDSNGKISRVAIPRVWYNISQKKLFYPASMGVIDSPTPQSDKAFNAIITMIDDMFSSKERLVGAYIAPEDNSLDGLSAFYKPAQNWTLPSSFIKTGSIKDLPKGPKIGTFLPITQLTFDIVK